jgi:hypothetical protein
MSKQNKRKTRKKRLNLRSSGDSRSDGNKKPQRIPGIKKKHHKGKDGQETGRTSEQETDKPTNDKSTGKSVKPLNK